MVVVIAKIFVFNFEACICEKITSKTGLLVAVYCFHTLKRHEFELITSFMEDVNPQLLHISEYEPDRTRKLPLPNHCILS